ncbi:bacillithiol biosynthesis cysteine-adding enzyme BshC [Bizionia sediminis]|uniref:Putative cysteine ligase BshC n=1 Tax=Bizionia sediminis TaxID=1737064 RepID=A0ABW5KRJ2_9FLAO
MSTAFIPYQETPYFSSLICKYLDQDSALKPFYNRFPEKSNFLEQVKEKQKAFTVAKRTILVKSLLQQYKHVNVSAETNKNITALEKNNTFTITTGHQLNIFTGPLYFFYKIISAVNLCKELNTAYPNTHFVPVYWMATEDHDFEEINYFNFKDKKVQWQKKASGAVGSLDLQGLEAVYNSFSNQLPKSKNAQNLRILFKKAYLENNTLAAATRYLVNTLFGDTGLVIVDGNKPELKKQFVPYAKEELLKQTAHNTVVQTNKKLNALPENYKIQVNPREINLFYLKANLRERIVFQNNTYHVLNTDISWEQNDLLNELEKYPERFSPNVILRPLYQEVVLPNICYIGGGGELAYWLQLHEFFKTQNVPFPMLLLRNSVLLATKKQQNKLEKLGLNYQDLFLKQPALITKVTKDVSAISIDFTEQKTHLEKQFKALYHLAEKTDKSFLGAVAAQEKKQLNGLDNLEKRLLKAQKRKQADVLNRVKLLQDNLFPNQSLQERQANFSTFYLEFGDQLIQQLMLNLQPLKNDFTILNLE